MHWIDELLLGKSVGAAADHEAPLSSERLRWMKSAQRLRKRASIRLPPSGTMFMWTWPSEPGTGISAHVRPPSAERNTALESLLPVQLSPASFRHWKTGI